MPTMESIYAEHTAALNRHSDSLDAFVKASGKGTTQATDEKPTRTRRTKEQIAADEAAEAKAKEAKSEPAKEDKTAPGIYDAVKAFLDYGKDDDAEDEDERERRAGFVKKMLRHFDVERARDIPEKNLSKVKRWTKLFADGEKVDFEVD